MGKQCLPSVLPVLTENAVARKYLADTTALRNMEISWQHASSVEDMLQTRIP